MSKVYSPLLSANAIGTIAGDLTFAKHSGRNTVRQRNVPRNPRTVSQQANRSKLSDAVVAWQALSEPQREVWREKELDNPGKTGYSLFIGAQMLIIPGIGYWDNDLWSNYVWGTV